MSLVAAIVNQKGGVGKTTITLGLASAARHAGHRVLVVDLDPQGSATWVLGTDPDDVVVSSAEVLTGDAPVVDGLRASGWGDAVHVLPASTRLHLVEHAVPSTADPDPALLLRAALREVSEPDLILVDCSPSLGRITRAALGAADLAVIVVEPAALAIRGITAIADVVDEIWARQNPDLDLAGVIVNRLPAISAEAERRYEELAEIVGRRAVWQPAVPQRVLLTQAAAERRPIHSYGARAHEVAEVFDHLWARLRRVAARHPAAGRPASPS